VSDPWFRFFPSDWISGVSGLSAAERGVYVTLLAIIYDQGGPIKRDDARLARQCGLPVAGFRRALEALESLGKVTVENGEIFNSRAKYELSERENRSARARDAAASSWEIRKQNQQTENATAKREQCESNATRARIPQPQPDPDKNTKIQKTSLGGLDASLAPRKARRAKARTQIEENAQPDEKDRVVAAEHGLSAEQFRTEWRKFRDHHLAAGSLFADWHAAWRKWCGNIPQFRRPPVRAGPPQREEKRNTVFQAAQEMMAELYGGTDGTSERPSNDFNGTTLDLSVEQGDRKDGPFGANQATRDDAASDGKCRRYEGDAGDLHGTHSRFARE
jgi:uncharacterized protein YdaU (DUF1376 family)